MIPTKVGNIMQKLIDNKYDAYIIGGAVRDILLDLKPHDWDIFTNCSGKQLKILFPTSKVLGGEERQKKILTVIVGNVEVSQYRSNGERTKTGKTLEEHLKTCDFGMNAMAMDINGKIINKHNGAAQLQAKILSTVGNPEERFKEDYLRILRGARFCLKYKLTLAEPTQKAIIKLAPKINELSAERIRDELKKILIYPMGINTLHYLGILEVVMPEVMECVLIEDGKYHKEGCVFNHMNYSYQNSCKLSNNPIKNLGVFLHDSGKSIVAKKQEDGNTTFYAHEVESEKIARKIMRRLKFSNDEIKYVTTLCRYHMVGLVEEIKDKTVKKLMIKLQSAGISNYDYVMMKYCDNQANYMKPRVKFGDFLNGYKLLKRIREMEGKDVALSTKDLKINGNDVIKIWGLKGKDIGDTLQVLFQMVFDGEIENDRITLLKEMKKVVQGDKNEI